MTALGRLASFVTRRPRLVACAWVLVVAVLALQGRNLDRELTLHPLLADGTQSKRAHEIALREFGGEHAIVVLLRGPEAAVERQGGLLARRLAATPGMLVISPWSPGAVVEGLRPGPRSAAVVVRVEAGSEEVSAVLPPVEREVEETVGGPVRASIAGYPAVLDSFVDASEEAIELGERIAVPALLIVLLLVFRSVLAALVPVLVGGAVVAASRGVLSLLNPALDLDLSAVGVVGMIGLALGVDYSLLVVSRYREERGRSADVREAVQATVRATARSVVPAGGGLLLAMAAAAFVFPGVGGRSVAFAVGTVAVLSVISALCVVPALLMLLGDNLDRWALPRRDARQAASFAWSRRITASPRVVTAIVIALLFLAGWAFTLDTGSGSVAQLPAGDPGRTEQETVERALGEGWLAPMEVVVDGRGGPVTTPARLRSLAAFQRRVERDPGVEAMAGFDKIERGSRELSGLESGLEEQERGLDRLDTGLARVHDGAKLNTGGLLKAAEGARALNSGIGATDDGAALLAETLQTATAGSERLTRGLGRVNDGSGELAEGTSEASSGAGRLAKGLRKAEEETGEIRGSARLLENAMRSGDERLDEAQAPLRGTGEQLDAALRALQRMTAGRSDPQYASALAAVEAASRHLRGTDPGSGEASGGVEEGVERAAGQFEVGLYLSSQLDESGIQAQKGMRKLAQGSERLDRGLQRLEAGSRRVSDGIAALSRGGEQLPPALTKLSDGADQLAAGLGQLGSGADQLAGGLGGGAQKSKLLAGALQRIGKGLDRRSSEEGGSQLDQLRARSPGLFRSGYLVLAGLDGSRPAQRDQLGFLVDFDSGGRYARMLVVPRSGPASDDLAQTRERLEAGAAVLARETDAEVVVGGAAPTAIDADEAIRDSAIPMRLALSLVSFLILVPVVRSLTLPLLAALLNLITVSATFGLLSLLFDGGLLGGPGYVDSATIPATITVMFGLAIDYEVFVFARIREEYVRTGSTRAAIEHGLGSTAHVITGAAAIMIAVFLAFSISPFMPLRNFGVAQAIGVFIDAFIIRLVVIPVAMRRLGRWCWWMPAWLDRLLPGGKPATAIPAPA